MYPKLELNFSKYTDDGLLALMHNVEEQMTKNLALFAPEFAQQLEVLKPMTLEFQDLVNKAKTRDTVAIARRNEYKKLYVKKIKEFATGINSLYEGQPEQIDACGFGVLTSAHAHYIQPITGVDLSQSKTKGQLIVKMVGGQNFNSVTIKYTTDTSLPEQQWMLKTSTKRTTEIGPFQRGSIVSVKLIAIGLENQEVESTVNTIGVQ